METNQMRDGIDYFDDMVAAQKRGESLGICSVCSSNPYVLRAAFRQALDSPFPFLVESTSNQVNQFGGYTGETPAQFRRSVLAMAGEYGLPPGRLILGGDHLGPNPWQREPAEAAMAKARQLVAGYVRAGYSKIHLDASMRLGDDPADGPSVELAAKRSAALCRAAEEAWRELGGSAPAPRYIVGTEVPLPGGEVGNEAGLQVTRVESARQTLELTRAAFRRAGAEAAWDRVFGLVVQPGVEFGDRTIHPYHPERAAQLSAWIDSVPGIVFEAHSTDYQVPAALAALVADHFAILKVGPGLTFAFREAVFALESIEAELLAGAASASRSYLQEVIDEEMLADPGYWQRYYPGSPDEQRLMRRFSLSDRIRYYWSKPRVGEALRRLLANLREIPIPPGLVSQYFMDEADLGGGLPTPEGLIESHIRRGLDGYWKACYLQ